MNAGQHVAGAGGRPHTNGLVCGLVFALVSGLLSGCGAVPSRMAPGLSRAEVLTQAGRPTATYPLPVGERLQYSELPAGVAVHNLDFNAQGQLVRAEQALTLASLHRIKVDHWTAANLRQLLGQPYRVERVARFDGDVWTYRFQDMGSFRFIHIHLDSAGVVRKIQFTDDLPELDDSRS